MSFNDIFQDFGKSLNIGGSGKPGDKAVEKSLFESTFSKPEEQSKKEEQKRAQREESQAKEGESKKTNAAKESTQRESAKTETVKVEKVQAENKQSQTERTGATAEQISQKIAAKNAEVQTAGQTIKEVVVRSTESLKNAVLGSRAEVVRDFLAIMLTNLQGVQRPAPAPVGQPAQKIPELGNAPSEIHQAYIAKLSNQAVRLEDLAKVYSWREFNGTDKLSSPQDNSRPDERIASLGRQLVEAKYLVNFNKPLHSLPDLQWTEDIKKIVQPNTELTPLKQQVLNQLIAQRVQTLHVALEQPQLANQIRSLKTDADLSKFLSQTESKLFPTPITIPAEALVRGPVIQQNDLIQQKAQAQFPGNDSVSTVGKQLSQVLSHLQVGKVDTAKTLLDTVKTNAPTQLAEWLKPLKADNAQAQINILKDKIAVIDELKPFAGQRPAVEAINNNFLDLMQKGGEAKRTNQILPVHLEATRQAILHYVRTPAMLDHVLNGKADIEKVPVIQAEITRLATGLAQQLPFTDPRYRMPAGAAVQPDLVNIPKLVQSMTFAPKAPPLEQIQLNPARGAAPALDPNVPPPPKPGVMPQVPQVNPEPNNIPQPLKPMPPAVVEANKATDKASDIANAVNLQKPASVDQGAPVPNGAPIDTQRFSLVALSNIAQKIASSEIIRGIVINPARIGASEQLSRQQFEAANATPISARTAFPVDQSPANVAEASQSINLALAGFAKLSANAWNSANSMLPRYSTAMINVDPFSSVSIISNPTSANLVDNNVADNAAEVVAATSAKDEGPKLDQGPAFVLGSSTSSRSTQSPAFKTAYSGANTLASASPLSATRSMGNSLFGSMSGSSSGGLLGGSGSSLGASNNVLGGPKAGGGGGGGHNPVWGLTSGFPVLWHHGFLLAMRTGNIALGINNRSIITDEKDADKEGQDGQYQNYFDNQTADV